MKPNKFIVITTINNPNKAVRLFSQLVDFRLIIVADQKTPKNWQLENAYFLSVEQQNNLNYHLCKLLPYNHYARKNIGYIYSIKNGAKIIVDTDDDNIPKDNWNFPDFQSEYLSYHSNLGFVNVYKIFTQNHIWPRGFPLDLINSTNTLYNNKLEKKSLNVGIWQGLADGDPDVDAIYRLVLNTPCFFDDFEPIVLSQGTICPFNSQNTAFHQQFFPLLYLPSFVSFRYTDILRGLVAQPILWLFECYLGFTKATVVQERNPHDYFKDFESEIPCYLHPYKVIDIVSKNIRTSFSVSDNLYQAYESLCKTKIVEYQEMKLLEAWLRDINN